jgi:ABC-type antimicrobial peptide transport system permease subunit
MDTDIPVEVTTLEEVISGSTAIRSSRFAGVLMAGLAGVAALLAVVGIYGVLASAVTQRSKEIGIRMALGASRRAVLREVLGRGLRLGMIGLAIGMGVALMWAHLLESLLYEVSPTDLTTLSGAAVLLLAAVGAASYVPARRATLVNPVETLGGD